MDWTDYALDRFGELLAEGKSLTEIAAYFGTSYDNIRQVKSTYKVGVRLKSRVKENLAPKSVKSDLASRIRMLLGEELLETAKEFSFPDEQIRKWLAPAGFVDFAREVLGVELQEYQVEMIGNILGHKRLCVVAGRGTGKSFTIAIACLFIAVTKSNQRILIVSPAQRQSDLLFGKVLEFIGKNNELFNSVSDSGKEKCVFTNNSQIFPLPSTSYIRGFQRVDFVFCDESAYFMNPDEAYAAVEPMTSIKNERGEYGSLIVVGSPAGKSGMLWNCFNNPVYVKMQIPSMKNKYVSGEWIESQKTSMPPEVFESEIMAQFSESIDNFFSYEVIRKCSKEYSFVDFPENEKEYFLGVDIGRVRDSSVITVISCDKEKQLKVEKIVELNGVEFKRQIEEIKLISNRFKAKKVCIEKAGLSMQMVEDLKREDGVNVLEFEPTIDNKAKGFENLLKAMQEGKLIIPINSDKLQYQLRTFKYEVTLNGKLKLHHESEYSRDDFVDSLMIGVWATKRNNGTFIVLEW